MNHFPSQINLSQVKPCVQMWDDMESSQGGRLCVQCQKTIVDFRKMQPDQVAEIHMFSEEPVCGIYSKKQLLSHNVTSKKSKSTKSLLSLGFFGLLSSFTQSEAQSLEETSYELSVERDRQTDLDKKRHLTVKDDTAAVNDSVFIKGLVLDPLDQAPLFGVTVYLIGTEIGTISDAKGHYYLDLTSSLEANEDLLVQYSYTGYGTDTFALSHKIISRPTNSSEPTVIEYNPSLTRRLDMPVFSVSRRPWYSRFWRWMTKPLR